MRRSWAYPGFNPHPAFLPGDAADILNKRCLGRVSIRTRHFCRVMLSAGNVEAFQHLVSIRTRHFCRVMRRSRRQWADWLKFQSAPGISAG